MKFCIHCGHAQYHVEEQRNCPMRERGKCVWRKLPSYTFAVTLTALDVQDELGTRDGWRKILAEKLAGSFRVVTCEVR